LRSFLSGQVPAVFATGFWQPQVQGEQVQLTQVLSARSRYARLRVPARTSPAPAAIPR
jgi:hypothetical protein